MHLRNLERRYLAMRQHDDGTWPTVGTNYQYPFRSITIAAAQRMAKEWAKDKPYRLFMVGYDWNSAHDYYREIT